MTTESTDQPLQSAGPSFTDQNAQYWSSSNDPSCRHGVARSAAAANMNQVPNGYCYSTDNNQISECDKTYHCPNSTAVVTLTNNIVSTPVAFVSSITVPAGWRRIHSKGVIIYIRYIGAAMASYMFQKTVTSICTCGLQKLLPDLFFCRHCLTLRCDFCVSHEIDTTYCAHCFENLSSTEAKVKKNRCGSCLECPRCFNTLSTRSYSRTSDPKKPPQKMYYLLCLFCNWRSHEPNVPDQPTSSGNWPLYKNPNDGRILDLINYYKSISLKELFDKQKRSTKNYGRNYMHFLEKFGLNAMMARKRAGLPNFPMDGNGYCTPQISPSEAIEDVPELSEDTFNKILDLKQISTLEQRFATPEIQNENIDDLFPIRKHLRVKHSLRCRVCEHNVVKPEYNAVKFKIKHLAYYHVPEIKIVKCEPLQAGKFSLLVLKLCNPAQTSTAVRFEKLDLETINVVREPRRLEGEDLITTPKQLPKPIPVVLELQGDIVVPEGEIKIAARDDTAEYDDTNEVNTDNDDPKYVYWRKGNKVALKFEVMPNENVHKNENVRVGFIMNFMYLDTMSHVINQKQPQSVLVPVKIVLHLPNSL